MGESIFDGNFMVSGQFSGSSFPWGQLSAGQFSWGGGNCPGAIIRGKEAIFLGDNFPDTVLKRYLVEF